MPGIRLLLFGMVLCNTLVIYAANIKCEYENCKFHTRIVMIDPLSTTLTDWSVELDPIDKLIFTSDYCVPYSYKSITETSIKEETYVVHSPYAKLRKYAQEKLRKQNQVLQEKIDTIEGNGPRQRGRRTQLTYARNRIYTTLQHLNRTLS